MVSRSARPADYQPFKLASSDLYLVRVKRTERSENRSEFHFMLKLILMVELLSAGPLT